MNLNKKIYKQIKKYNNIFIARHIGADPDALGSQFGLKEFIINNFPHKNVYALGSISSKFRFMGSSDRIDGIPPHSLLVVLDTPDIKRIDGVSDLSAFEYIIKIDHHPVVDKFANLELIDDNASSTCQLIIELLLSNRVKITKDVASRLFIGVVGDTDRFLHDYTSIKTLKLVTKLIEKTGLDFTSLYEDLYLRSYDEIKFQGYIFQNMKINDNGLAYIKITDKVLHDYDVDPAVSGNMINSLKFAKEIVIWVFLTEDKEKDQIKVNIRSSGPEINSIAMIHGGGGHKFASGVKLKSWDEAFNLLDDLNEELIMYNKKKEKN